MTKALIRLFVKNHENTRDPAVRGAYGRMAGVVGIFCNLLLFAGKFIAGTVFGSIAIAALDYTVTRTLAAQAADELLNISGIDTSFVLYPQDGVTYISARSLGDANVQVILEPLGGGGNAATAGAQVKNHTVQQTLDELLQSINKFYES